jgi:hypothetical protein
MKIVGIIFLLFGIGILFYTLKYKKFSGSIVEEGYLSLYFRSLIAGCMMVIFGIMCLVMT